MSRIVSFTRWLVALAISAHMASLSLVAKAKWATYIRRQQLSDVAVVAVSEAKRQLTAARDAEGDAYDDYSATRTAIVQEAKSFGRSVPATV